MRLDEHGRWVSDDGAYVWDEAAQTWLPSSAAPPVSSGGAAGWPDANDTTGGPSATRTGGWGTTPGATGARVVGAGPAGPVGPSLGPLGAADPLDPLGLTGPGPSADRTGATDLGRPAQDGTERRATDLGGTGFGPSGFGPSGFGGTGLNPTGFDSTGFDSTGFDSTGPGAAQTGAHGLPTYGGSGQPGQWGGPPVTGGSQARPAPEARPGAAGAATGFRAFPGSADATGANPLSAPAAFSGAGTPAGPGGYTGPNPRTGPVDLTGPNPSPMAAPAGPGHDSAATGEIRRVPVPGPVASTWGARGLDDQPGRGWDDDDLADEPGSVDDEFDDEEDGDGWAPPEPRSRRRETSGHARSEGPRGRVAGVVANVRNRPPLLIAAAVVLVCLGVGVIGFLALGGGGSGSPTASGTGAAGKGRYAPEIRQAYLSSCLDVSNGNEGYCTCTLDTLEADYTQEEYQRFSDNVESESSQRIVREIYSACRDKR